MQDVTRPAQAKLIENARIIFRNFAGLEGQYNRAGDRNFGLVLTPEQAKEMEAEGWNVKYLRAREEGDEPTPWVQVSVSYKGRPPRIVMITYKGDEPRRVTLPEDAVELVDYADIANVDLILNPYTWNVSGKSGVKAYLKSMFVTISQDELERKYASVKEMDINGAPLEITATPHEDDEIIIEEDDIEDYR
jgi:hypothetical protein